MPSFHFGKKVMGRGAGATGARNTVAAASYRSAEALYDEQHGRRWRYDKDADRVAHAEIMAPEHAPAWMQERERLWNAVEQKASRSTRPEAAQLAMEYELALPHELTDAQRLELVQTYCREKFVSKGRVVDFAIHKPTPEQGQDARQYHVHIMVGLREVTAEGFGKQHRMSREEWATKDKATYREREEWAEHENRALEAAGIEARVDPRSFEARGIDREPEQHAGPHASAMDREGKDTRIAEQNRQTREDNRERVRRHMKALHELVRIEEDRAKFETWQAERRAQLAAAQSASRADLTTKQERDRAAFAAELNEAYGASLATVKAAAAAVEARLQTPGFRGLWRAVSGKNAAEREDLKALRAEILDTVTTIETAKRHLAATQAQDMARLKALQEKRQQQQHEGFEQSRARKEQALSDRLAKARQEAEATAEKESDLAAELDGVREFRNLMHEQRRIERLKQAAQAESDKQEVRDKTPGLKLNQKRMAGQGKPLSRPGKPLSKEQADRIRQERLQRRVYEQRQAEDAAKREAFTAAKSGAEMQTFRRRQAELAEQASPPLSKRERLKQEIDRQREQEQQPEKIKDTGPEFEP